MQARQLPRSHLLSGDPTRFEPNGSQGLPVDGSERKGKTKSFPFFVGAN